MRRTDFDVLASLSDFPERFDESSDLGQEFESIMLGQYEEEIDDGLRGMIAEDALDESDFVFASDHGGTEDFRELGFFRERDPDEIREFLDQVRRGRVLSGDIQIGGRVDLGNPFGSGIVEDYGELFWGSLFGTHGTDFRFGDDSGTIRDRD